MLGAQHEHMIHRIVPVPAESATGYARRKALLLDAAVLEGARRWKRRRVYPEEREVGTFQFPVELPFSSRDWRKARQQRDGVADGVAVGGTA